jgi:hypothetical protein
VGGARAGVAWSGAASRELFLVSQLEFPSQLVVRGDRVEVGYDAQKTPDAVATPDATGTLFVSNDLQRSFTAVPLKIRKALQKPSNAQDRLLLRALVPARLLGGHRLFYYAVIRNRAGRSVTVPAAGTRTPESVWIINNAYRVQLGAHVFGRTQTPEAIVAKAGPAEVSFNVCPPGGDCGQQSGPLSFEVAKDRSVWLIDGPPKAPDRLLMWTAGQPNAIAGTVTMPFGLASWDRAVEFAVGPAGSQYLMRGGPPTAPRLGSGGPANRVTRLSAGGKVLWTVRIATDIFNTQLRTGPDGTLYWTGAMHYSGSPFEAREASGARPWVPVATPAGRPLSRAAQERGTRWAQPLAGGLQLVGARAGYVGFDAHEARVALVNRAGRVVRAWRITSPTIIPWEMDKTPGLVAGDPVVVLTAISGHYTALPGAQPPKVEYLVLRLGPRGGVLTRFALPNNDPPRTPFANFAITEIRVQPDGKLYQLGSAPDFGAAIYRYSLRPTDPPRTTPPVTG